MATYSGQTPIKGKSRGDPAKIKKWLRQQGVGRPEDADDYVDGLYEMAPDFGINADVAVAQFIKEASRREPPHEPGHGVPWLHGLNPVGIGVTSDAQWRVYQFVTGRNAAMVHLMQLSIYVNGLDLPPGYRIEAPYEDAPNPPPRWYTTIKATPSRIKSARVLSDLDNRWAVPGVNYGAHIGQILNRFEAAGLLTNTTPDPQPDPQEGNDMAELNFDPKLVPMPKYRFKLAVNKREGVGMNRFGPRVHRGIVFHRALSNNQSLDTAVGWLLRSDVQGLTDGFIDHRTGEMVIINPMKAMFPGEVPANWQDMAGWANGPYSATASWPDGRAFRNTYGGRLGANIINQDLESMEVTGNYETAISEACKATLTQWAASRAQYHKIPWDKFPIIPSTGLTMIYGHREFCGDGHKVCPGKTVWDFINGEMIDRVRAVLKKAQTSGATTPAPKPDPQQPSDPWPYAEAHIPECITNPGAKPYLEDGNGTTLFWTDKQYVAVRPTKRLKYAYDGAPEVGPIIPAGMDFNVAFVFTAHDGKKYGLTPYGTRVLLDDLKVVSDGPLVGDVIDAVKDVLDDSAQ